MPKYLNNIDLNGNQLLSPVIHVSSQSTTTNGPAGDATGTEGQIFYNSHSSAKALYFRDDSGWRPIGDISGVTAGAGLSGGGAGGTVSLAIDISEFSDVTPANGDKLLTLDSDGSTEQLTTVAALATLFAGSGLTATNSVIAVDTLNQDTTGSAATLTTARTIGGVSFDGSANINLPGVNTSGNQDTSGNAATATALETARSFTTTGDVVLASANFDGSANFTTTATIQANAVEGSMLNNNVVSGQTALTSGLASTDELMVSDAGTLKRMDVSVIQSYLQSNLTFTTNTDNDVSVANLKTALADGFPSNAATIGDSDDTITFANDVVISGDLNVTGDTVTTTTTTITTQDPIIRLANNNAADTIDIGFYGTYVSTIDSVSATRYSGLFRDADEDTDSWTLFKDVTAEPGTTVNTAHATYSLADLKLGTLKATSIQGTLATASQTNITGVGTITTGVWNGTVIASAYLDSDTAHVSQTQTLTNKTLTSPVLNTGVSGTAIKDEDDMTSNSATHLATQQSIKAYVDSQTSSSSNTGGRQAFNLNNSVSGVAVSNSNKTYTITHGMGASLNYGVEVIRAANGSGETVYTDVTRTTTTIVIDFAVAPTAGDYTALVCKY